MRYSPIRPWDLSGRARYRTSPTAYSCPRSITNWCGNGSFVPSQRLCQKVPGFPSSITTTKSWGSVTINRAARPGGRTVRYNVSFHRRPEELHGGQPAQPGDDSVSERPSHGGERLQQDDEVSTFCDLPPLPPEPGGFKAISRWLRSEATTPPDPDENEFASRRDASVGRHDGVQVRACDPFGIQCVCRSKTVGIARTSLKPPANG